MSAQRPDAKSDASVSAHDPDRMFAVIVNYFSADLVGDLLSSLRVADFNTVIIVDNSANSQEEVRIRSLACEAGAEVLTLESNVGFGPAVNRGVRKLSIDDGARIWILNPDTRPEPLAATMLVDAMERYSADLVSPVLTTGASGDAVWFAGGVFDATYGRSRHLTEVPAVAEEFSFLTAAALMITGRAWRLLEGFREDLFMYWEDADLSVRANSLGLKMLLVPEARVWHAVGATSSEVGRSELFHYYMQRNRVIVLGELFGIRYLFGILRLFEALKLVRRALGEPTGKFGKAYRSCIGFTDGLKMAVGRGSR
ncbi:glycosyltransferase [Rhodococcus sp. NPDC127530]|uniref:glycosyltransferase n=1 Tax=unclassified Rhodococcus (in: high G+C Gram-positive bacteria) TaxID=192944 RepID=UPI0036416632